ncbi:MAG TPA: hypothetical protein VLQ68_03785 [Rhizobiaceae bacterium]|nr:hypothetical protein [Rhizobiaceae bacterium]
MKQLDAPNDPTTYFLCREGRFGYVDIEVYSWQDDMDSSPPGELKTGEASNVFLRGWHAVR